MASVLSDDEGEERSHPLTQERPGVYVQVVSPRRRKARKSQQDAAAASQQEPAPSQEASAAQQPTAQTEARTAHEAELIAADAPALGNILDSAIDAHPKGPSQPAPAPESERPSGEREIIAEAPAGYVRSVSQNSNGRADGVVITLPPPPRVPSFLNHGLTQVERDFARSAIELAPSVLDAPTSMRAAPAAARRTPWGMVALVAALSAIVASAVVVALRGSDAASDAAPLQPPAELPPDSVTELPAQEAAPSPAALTDPPAGQTPAPVAAPPSAAPVPARRLPAMGPGGVLLPSAPAAETAPGRSSTPRAAASATSAVPAQRPLPVTPAPAAAAQRPLPSTSSVVPQPPLAGPRPAAAKPTAEPAASPSASPEPAAPAELPDNPYAE